MGVPFDRDEARAQLGSLAADRVSSGRRAAAPWWLIFLHGLSVAGFVVSFGLGAWQSAGFTVSATVFVALGIIRPWITRTQAEPWSRSRRAVRPGVLQFVVGSAVIAVGVVAYEHFNVSWALWPAAVLAGATTVLFGLQMERALAQDVSEGL
jgi:hypothetical protein